MSNKTKKQEPLQRGDRVWVAGKPGTITGFSKDGQRVPWIVCDDGETWDARDLGSVYRIPTLKQAAEKVLALMRAPGATMGLYKSIEWEAATDWLGRAVEEENRKDEIARGKVADARREVH